MSPGAHYANSWSADSGRCFRYVTAIGRPERCPGPVRWRGRLRAPDGRSHRVEACEEHAGDLVARVPLIR